MNYLRILPLRRYLGLCIVDLINWFITLSVIALSDCHLIKEITKQSWIKKNVGLDVVINFICEKSHEFRNCDFITEQSLFPNIKPALYSLKLIQVIWIVSLSVNITITHHLTLTQTIDYYLISLFRSNH
jgi:hypothetical protein